MMSDFIVDDPVVDMSDVTQYNMAFMMQFFVQHKGTFGFPRLRLQDLYNPILMGRDLVALSDLVARIIRYLRRGDPTVSIATVDEALDTFVCEKCTTHRQEIQTARAGRSISNLDTSSRALLLEHLIECVYDEIPSLTIRAEGNEDVLVLNAGQDASGSRYFYMDDLRLYRETPKSELTSTWSLAVGASADQWKSFIESIGSAPEEIELANFLKTEIFPVLANCFETVTKLTDDLNPSHLLEKELSELSKMRQLKGLPPLPPTATSPNYATCTPPTDNGVSVGGGNSNGGSSAGSNSGNSTSTCPLTPPNGTPGVNQSSQPLKTSSTAPNTPSTLSWQQDGQFSSSITNNQQPTSLGQHPHSVGSISSVRSPPANNSKPLQNSPLRRPSSGPKLEHELKREGDAEGVKTHSAPSSVSEGVRKISIHSPALSNNCKLQSVPEGSSRDSKVISSSMASVQQQQQQQQQGFGPAGSTVPAAVPVSPATHAMVFTTEMANDAAAKNRRSRIRLTTYHSTHPTVQSYMLQHGMFHTTTAVAAAAISVDGSSVTQEQLENRKNKMATLERIHFTLTKNKTSAAAAQGGATIQQQQQMYTAVGQMGGTSASSCSASAIPPMHLHDPSHPPGDIPLMEPRGMMMTNREMAWMQQQRRQQQQQQPLSTVRPPSPINSGDPNGGMGNFSYSSMDPRMYGPPVLAAPDNAYPSAPPQPPPNKFCVPAPPPYGNINKRPYPSSDPLSSGLPDNHQSQFWGPQQQAMMDQQAAMMQQQSQNALPTPRTTTGRGGGGVSKKRKTGTTAASRAAARAGGSQGPTPGFNPAAQRMPPTQQPQIPPGMKSGGFGTVPIGPPRGNYQSAMIGGGGDLMNGGPCTNPNYRGGPMVGPGTMMDQPLYLPVAVGPGGQLPPSSMQQPQQQSLSISGGGYSHPPNDGMTPSSNTSTQHLTSASLASLARLSQLSGTEGPYCPQPTNSNPNVPTPALSRMTSAPDMFGGGGFPGGGGGPGMMSNPEGDPSSMYSMPGNSNAPTYQQQSVPMPQSGGQQPGFHPSPHQQTLGDVAATATSVVSTRCLTPNSAPPICGPPPISTSPSTPTGGGAAVNSLPPNQASQSGATQQPQQQSSGPTQQQSSQFQQMNYSHMNGSPQLHPNQFMQQQPSRQFYGVNNGPTCPPPPNQRLEPPRNLPQPQPPTNVQITPKTPHTIQYLPTTSATTTTTGLPGGNTTSISNAPSGGPYPSGPQKVRAPSGHKLQSPSHTQVAPNATVQPTTGPNSLPSHPSSSAARRGPKMDQLPAQPGSMPMASSNPSDMVAGMPEGSGMYTTGPQPKYPNQQQQQRFSMTADPMAQQPDNANPFDFPQGATPYPNTTVSQPRGMYRDPSMHLQQQPQQYPPSNSTGPGYRSVETDAPQMVPAAPNTTISASKNVLASSAATSGPQQPQQQIYASGGDMNYPQSQPRWQQQPQMMGGNANDFYVQQQQQGVVMMPTSQGGATSQSQAAGFYMQPQSGGSGVPPSHLQQPTNPTPPHQQNQGHTNRPYPALL